MKFGQTPTSQTLICIFFALVENELKDQSKSFQDLASILMNKYKLKTTLVSQYLGPLMRAGFIDVDSNKMIKITDAGHLSLEELLENYEVSREQLVFMGKYKFENKKNTIEAEGQISRLKALLLFSREYITTKPEAIIDAAKTGAIPPGSANTNLFTKLAAEALAPIGFVPMRWSETSSQTSTTLFFLTEHGRAELQSLEQELSGL